MRKVTKRVKTKDPVGVCKLGDLLPQLIVRFGLHRRQNVEVITAAWKEAVGPPYDAVSRAVSLSRGTLEIAVPHTAFVQELSFRQAELLAHLQAALPTEKIRKLKFVVSQ